MSKYDEKYEAVGEESASSHIRGIIQQLNDEKPSQEKSREVVVRSDGTKVVRVRKKRRVVVTDAEKRKAGRRSFMLILLGAFLLCMVSVGWLLFRMSQMSGEAYVQGKAEELRQAWGAETVRLVGSGVEGSSFHLTGLAADFPAGAPVQHVELSDISADLDTATFFTGVLTSEKMTIKRAEVKLNPEARELQMPLFRGEELWRISSIECESLSISMGEQVNIANSRGYLYHPRRTDRSVCTFVLSGGVLQLRGMQQIRLSDSKFLMSPVGIEEFSVNGTTDRAAQDAGKINTSLAIVGRVKVGDALAGPFEFDSDSMPLSVFTDGRLGDILSARTMKQSVGQEHSRARILLPLDEKAPSYSGEFLLKDISLSGFPVQEMILKHIEDDKRSDYRPMLVRRGHLNVQSGPQGITVEFPENQVEELDVVSLKGSLSVNADNEVSGTLSIGLPAILTHAEYADGKADPVFSENAGMAWVTAELSGSVNVPGDNSAMLEAQTEEERSSRPGRLNLDDVNISKISNQINKNLETLHEADSTSTPAEPRGDKKEEEDASETPSMQRGSLDMSSPLDDNFKGIFD